MNLLMTIDSGNRLTIKQKQQSTGLTKSVSAYGIVGLLLSYYKCHVLYFNENFEDLVRFIVKILNLGSVCYL